MFIVYCSYGLAFDDLKLLQIKKLSNDQNNLIALGLVYAAAWNKYWFQRKETESVAKLALKLSTNDKLSEKIKKFL
jgi:hypothetical protein